MKPRSLIEVIDRFGDLVDQPRVPRPEYVEVIVRRPDPRAYTEQELRWMAEAQLEQMEEQT